jgi:hypothetical protein
LRIGLASPGSGSPSGIGAYSEEVARAWPHGSGQLVRFVDTSASSERPAVGEWSVGALGRYLPIHDLDDMVVALGSSPYHAASVAVAERWPTHVWLHEATLVGCHVGVAHLSGNEQWARQMIGARLGERLGEFDDVLDADEHHRRGVTFLEPVLRSAESVIVSSQAAADVVSRTASDSPPILVLPLAFRPAARVESAPRASIVSAGWVDHGKRPGVLVHLAAILDVDVTMVGSANGTVADDINQLAHRLGVAHRIHLTGRVTDAEYDRHLRSHRVAVQLRSDMSGQMSAAVNDFVSRGIPVVTSMTTHPEIGEKSLQHVRLDGLSDADAALVIVETVRPLLVDDQLWYKASEAGSLHATTWTPTHVAERLATWVSEFSSRPRGSVEIAGPQ